MRVRCLTEKNILRLTKTLAFNKNEFLQKNLHLFYENIKNIYMHIGMIRIICNIL